MSWSGRSCRLSSALPMKRHRQRLKGDYMGYASRPVGQVEFEVASARIEEEEGKYIQNKNLHLTVNIKDAGYLKDGKITFKNTNFNILASSHEIEEIKSINNKSQEIRLNKIKPSTVVLEVPIGFKNDEAFDCITAE